MKMIIKRFLLSSCVCLLSAGTCMAQIAHKSQWVYPDAKGKLMYKTLEGGDKIMDFSYAGYMGGGVSIPLVPVTVTLSPVAGDNSAAIQKAIDEVSQMKIVNGFRGTILLKSGTYDLSLIHISEPTRPY